MQKELIKCNNILIFELMVVNSKHDKTYIS